MGDLGAHHEVHPATVRVRTADRTLAEAAGDQREGHVELNHGDVSLAYVSKLMHRKYRDTPLFKKVLQGIWHQVNSGQEVYVVGRILEDDTVKGALRGFGH